MSQLEPEKTGRYERFKSWVKGSKPSSVRRSDRFVDAGLFDFREQENVDYRVFQLTEILEKIEEELTLMGEGIPTEKNAFKNIKRLFRAFLTMASPWFRGLDNRELARKAVAFFELETMVGHLPAFYPDLKLCTETLINLSWQAIDVTPQNQVIFESKVQKVEQGMLMPRNPSPTHIGSKEE